MFGAGDHRRHKRWFTNPALDLISGGLRPLRERFGSSGCDLTWVALRYSLQQADHTAVVVGFSEPAQIKQNVDCLGEPLTVEELAFVENVYGNLRRRLQRAGDSYLVEVPV